MDRSFLQMTELTRVGEQTDILGEVIREMFDFRPAAIIRDLDLRRPIYRKTTNYGHFGREDDLESLTWERTD